MIHVVAAAVLVVVPLFWGVIMVFILDLIGNMFITLYKGKRN